YRNSSLQSDSGVAAGDAADGEAGGAPAVDREVGTGDVGRGVTEQEDDSTGDLDRFAEPAEDDRALVLQLLGLGIRGEVELGSQQRGVDRARTHRVDADVVESELGCRRTRHREDATLRGGIGGIACLPEL